MNAMLEETLKQKQAFTVDALNRLDALVAERCAHIQDPMTLDELAAYVGSNDYSAELALQHAMLLLAS